MIFLQAAPQTVEIPDVGASTVIVQATIPALENMHEREAAAWRVVQEALLHGTDTFTLGSFLRYGSQAGIPPAKEAMPDFLTVRIVAPAGGLDLAAQLLESALEEPRLTTEEINAAIARLRQVRRDAWQVALDPLDIPLDRLRLEDVQRVYTNAFQVERIRFVVTGAFQPDMGRLEMANRFNEQSFARPMRRLPDLAVRPASSVPGRASAFLLTAPPIDFEGPDDWANVLATFALGVGKTGSMHRVLRERLALTYRQESVLFATLEGLQPRLIALRETESGEDLTETLETMRLALLEDIETWDAATLATALGNARAGLLEGSPFSPLWVSPQGPLAGGAPEAAAWRGYLELIGKGPWSDRNRLVAQLEQVELEDLQSAAKQLLENASTGVIPAGG